MTAKSVNPPDFDNWEFEEKVSLFFDPHAPDGERAYTVEFKADDKEYDHWLGIGLIYKSKDGFASGREYNIFDRGPKIKLWRLIGDPKEDFHFAVLNDANWEIYSSLIYLLHLGALARKNNPTRIVVCEIWVDIQKSQQIMLKTQVQRE